MTTLSIDPFPLLADLPIPRISPFGATNGGGTHEMATSQAFAEGRRAGFEEGRHEGRARGAAEARLELAQQIEVLGAALRDAAAGVGTQLAELAEHMNRTVVDLALEVAAAVVDHEISVSDSPGRAALARAVAAAPDRVELIARLHPDDAALIQDGGPDGRGLDGIAPGRSITVVADPSVDRGGCLLDAGGSRIDAGIATAFARVRAALLGVDDTPVDTLS